MDPEKVERPSVSLWEEVRVWLLIIIAMVGFVIFGVVVTDRTTMTVDECMQARGEVTSSGQCG